MEYPILAIEPHGFTAMLKDSSYWKSLPISYISLYRKRLNSLVFYGKDGNKWRLKTIEPDEPIGFFGKIFGGLREIKVRAEFVSIGPYEFMELQSMFKSSVEADDDILCQHHSQNQVIEWINQAKSIGKLFSLYIWIRKDFAKE
ncbi:MAG: hypothetical protein OEY58_18600 [Gammaproteobacteria bacterium]|nr:hypothetical protein [Gammaproteobacteria bacterium]